MVEFVSYNGRYPNLCHGELVVRIDGVNVNLGKNCLCSGGRVWFDKDWGAHIESGDWEVEVPERYEYCLKEIERVVNDNIPHGCCGGCV